MGVVDSPFRLPPLTEHEAAMDAIARGRAALAHPLPPPRCDTPYLQELRMERSRLFVACHTARGGHWS